MLMRPLRQPGGRLDWSAGSSNATNSHIATRRKRDCQHAIASRVSAPVSREPNSSSVQRNATITLLSVASKAGKPARR